MSEVDSNEIHQAYQRALKDKEIIENENISLKEQVQRLTRSLPLTHGSHSRSISNASSINNDEDFGYASAKNTLELKKNSLSFTPPPSEKHAINNESNTSDSLIKTSTYTMQKNILYNIFFLIFFIF